MLQLGILKTFDSEAHKAGVQLVGSLTTYLDDISVSVSIPSSAMIIGNYVLVAIPGGNPRDACIVASWPQGSSGGGGGSKIQDADGDTYLWVEKTADEDKIHGVVKDVEAFLLDDAGILTLAKQCAVEVYQTSDQTIPVNVDTLIDMDTKAFDIHDDYDLSTDTFTAPVDGIYFACGQMQITHLYAGEFALVSFFKNGVRVKFAQVNCPADNKSPCPCVSGFLQLSANDTVQFKGKHYHTPNADTNGAQDRTYFGIAKIA
jgi:hypothetical protein